MALDVVETLPTSGYNTDNIQLKLVEYQCPGYVL